MILVTLGTQDKPFVRLLETIQKEIDAGIIKDKVIVQAGCTVFESSAMELYDLLPMEQFESLIEKCDILITHGGVGSIMAGLNHGKKIIAVARLKKYKEHVNDHQVQIIENFMEEGYVLGLQHMEDFHEVYQKIKDFVPRKYQSNRENMIHLIREYIENN